MLLDDLTLLLLGFLRLSQVKELVFLATDELVSLACAGKHLLTHWRRNPLLYLTILQGLVNLLLMTFLLHFVAVMILLDHFSE